MAKWEKDAGNTIDVVASASRFAGFRQIHRIISSADQTCEWQRCTPPSPNRGPFKAPPKPISIGMMIIAKNRLHLASQPHGNIYHCDNYFGSLTALDSVAFHTLMLYSQITSFIQESIYKGKRVLRQQMTFRRFSCPGTPRVQ